MLDENICCGYPLEVPRWGASNMFSSSNKKTTCIYRIHLSRPMLGILCIWTMFLFFFMNKFLVLSEIIPDKYHKVPFTFKEVFTFFLFLHKSIHRVVCETCFPYSKPDWKFQFQCWGFKPFLSAHEFSNHLERVTACYLPREGDSFSTPNKNAEIRLMLGFMLIWVIRSMILKIVYFGFDSQ